MLVGDLQRVIEYPKLDFAIEQDVPEDVHAAYESLIERRLHQPPPQGLNYRRRAGCAPSTSPTFSPV